jgi:hypothetical protein
MTLSRALLVALLPGLVLAGSLLAADPVSEIRDVEIKMVLLDVDEINNVKQTFAANLAMAMRWQDHSLVHQKPSSNRHARWVMPLIYIGLVADTLFATFTAAVDPGLTPGRIMLEI